MPLCCVVPVTHNGLVKTTVSNHSIPCSQSFFLPLWLITCPPLLIRHVVWMLQDIYSFTYSFTFLCPIPFPNFCSMCFDSNFVQVYGRGTSGEKAELEGLSPDILDIWDVIHNKHIQEPLFPLPLVCRGQFSTSEVDTYREPRLISVLRAVKNPTGDSISMPLLFASSAVWLYSPWL